MQDRNRSRDIEPSKTFAGLRAGAIAGVLFTGAFTALDFILVWRILPGTILTSSETDRIATQTGTVYTLMGVLLALTFSGILGAVAGAFYGKVVDKLPLRSTYVKVLSFGFCLWLTVAVVVRWSVSQYPPTLIMFALDSLLFAYLFKSWTMAEGET